MSDTTWDDGAGRLRDVREGMTVVDASGEELGTVTEVRFGDTRTVTTEGQAPELGDDGVFTAFARALDDGPQVPDQDRARLLRLGYLRVGRLLARDLYAAADEVDGVEGETVRLVLTEDQLSSG